MNQRLPRVIFLVEGNTDIRFVTGLSEVCDLTLVVPEAHYVTSGLEQRVREQGAKLTVAKLPGGRLAYQFRSLKWLWRNAQQHDVILSQELLRGTLNANLIGRLRGVPVLASVLTPPLEYYRCRRRLGGNTLKQLAGETVIRVLLQVNGRLVTRCLALGTYLEQLTRRYSPRVELGHYYGVDTRLFRPAEPAERAELRRRHNLPPDKFLILAASRVSHEKDPATALRGVALARQRGLDAVILNLGGGYQEFLTLAKALGLPDYEQWVLGRPAQHPMKELADFFRCADALVQSSLEEGLGLSPLEALFSGTPVVATEVGGMALTLPGHARLTPREDPEAIARELAWIAQNPSAARTQALHAREQLVDAFSREQAFAHWRAQFNSFLPGAK